MKKYRNIRDYDICVNGENVEAKTEFEGDEKSQEIKNLIYHKYIELI